MELTILVYIVQYLLYVGLIVMQYNKVTTLPWLITIATLRLMVPRLQKKGMSLLLLTSNTIVGVVLVILSCFRSLQERKSTQSYSAALFSCTHL